MSGKLCCNAMNRDDDDDYVMLVISSSIAKYLSRGAVFDSGVEGAMMRFGWQSLRKTFDIPRVISTLLLEDTDNRQDQFHESKRRLHKRLLKFTLSEYQICGDGTYLASLAIYLSIFLSFEGERAQHKNI